MLLTRVPGLPQAIEIAQGPDKKFKQGFIGAPAAAEGSENKQQVPLLSHSLRGGQACSLYGVRGGVCPGVRPEGWLRRSGHPSGGVVCRGHA